MKTAISIPDDVYRAVDQTAHRLGYSRSELFTRAVERFLTEQPDDPVTAALDAAYGDTTDADVASYGRQLIDGGAWAW